MSIGTFITAQIRHYLETIDGLYILIHGEGLKPEEEEQLAKLPIEELEAKVRDLKHQHQFS